MNVRPATEDDVDAVHRVATAAWHAAYDEVIGADAVDRKLADWYDPDLLADSVTREEGYFLVAEDDGDVIAFASGGPSDEAYADAVLARIYAGPDRWGDGAGTALLDALTDRLVADGHDDIWLAVMADNDVGVSFYRARGFEVIEERAVELAGQATDDYVMARDL
jgi:ribosomal protein S18 acetylase RimI-like enzyme